MLNINYKKKKFFQEFVRLRLIYKLINNWYRIVDISKFYLFVVLSIFR